MLINFELLKFVIMDTTHLHLISNHVPVFALIFSLLLFVLGDVLKNRTLLNTAMAGFIIAAIASVIAFTTGEAAEESIESIAGTEAFIEEHEDIAKPANITAIILGTLAIIAVIFEMIKNAIPVYLKRIILFVSCIAVVLVSYTAYLGGLIRHTEVRTGTSSYTIAPESKHSEHYDD